MSEQEKSLVLIPKRHPIKEISTSTLFDFLAQTLYFPARPEHFAKKLDLIDFTPFLSYLQANFREDFIYSNEERQASANLKPEDLGIPKSLIKSVVNEDDFKESIEQHANERAGVERSIVVYYDWDGHYIDCTEPKFGTHKSTEVETYNVLEQERTPLLEVHTHPENALLSPVDYSRLLTASFGYNERILRGLVLICPENQVLALASSETPILSPTEVTALNNKWIDFYRKTKDPQILKVLYETTWKTQEAVYEHAELAGQRALALAEEVGKRYHNDEISKHRARKELKGIKKGLAKDIHWFGKTHLPQSLKGIYAWSSYSKKVENMVRVELARAIGVKLYSSTNMRDFTEFTA